MQPILLIGPLALPTYPLALLLAFFAATSLGARRAEALNIDGDHVHNAGLYALLAGILGARIWFVLSHWDNYATDLGQALSLSRSALSLPEGLMVAGLVILIYLQRNQVPLSTFLDAVTPGLALAFVIGYVGAFFGGEALGAPSTLPWAADIAGTTRHPVQLYEAAAGIIIFAVLYMYDDIPWSGFQFWLFVALAGTARLIFEIFRARPALVGDGFLAGQLAALMVIIVALGIMAYNFRHDHHEIQVEGA